MDTELRWEGEGAVGSAGSYLAQYIAGFRLCMNCSRDQSSAVQFAFIARGNTKCSMCVDHDGSPR